MVKNLVPALMAALWLLSFTAFADDGDSVIVYQVGSAGAYCLSLTPNEKGCVSGTKEDGSTVNVMSVLKGRNVVFRNLSDAPHDMRFTGANQEDLPAQFPNAADAQKKLGQEDPNRERIICSFHGPQLTVGYSVAGGKQAAAGGGGGHKDPVSGEMPSADKAFSLGIDTLAKGGPASLGRMITTGLADVSSEVLKRGRPADVERLVGQRPELIEKLKEIRPLLAEEIGKTAGGRPVAGSGAGIVKSNLGDFQQTGLGFVGGQPATVVATNEGIGANNLGGGGAKSLARAGGAGGGGSRSIAGGGEDDDEAVDASRLGADGSALAEGQVVVGIDADGKKIMRKRTPEETKAWLAAGGNTKRGTDRTRLKGVRRLAGVADDDGATKPWHKWLILFLAIIMLIAARKVASATAKPKRKA